MSSACWHNNARVSVLTQPRLADDIATNILQYLPIADLLSLDSHDTSLIPTSTWLSLSKNFVRPHDDPASAAGKVRISFPIAPNHPDPHYTARALVRSLLADDNFPKTLPTKATTYLYNNLISPSNAVAPVPPPTATSVDRSEENPTHTLSQSICYGHLETFVEKRGSVVSGIGLRAQMICGCVSTRPCYWSSAPSQDANMIESITYSLPLGPQVVTVPKGGGAGAGGAGAGGADVWEPPSFQLEPSLRINTISGFAVTPYQAYAHPNEPIYAPRAVSLTLETESLGVYFTSENFPCAQSRETQFFNLAHPCLCLPGSAVKISFLGAWQRQTIDLDATEFSGMGARNDYYICVCEVRIFEGTATNKGEDRFEYQLGEGREGEEGVVIECRVKSGRRGQREK